MSSWTSIPPPEWLETEQEVVAAAQYLHNSCMTGTKVLGFDTETTGLEIAKDYPILLSLSDGERRFACLAEWARIPWIRDGLLSHPQIVKTGTNLNFDRHMLANIGVEIAGEQHETLVMDWLCDENRSHGLKETAKDHLGIQMLSFKEVFGLKPKETPGDAIRRTMADPAGRARAIEYSGLDAFASVKVHDFLLQKLLDICTTPNPDDTLYRYFLDWEVPFTPLLYSLERRGFTICTGHLRAQMGPMEQAMIDYETQLAQMAGWVVNMNSPQQLQRLFFEQLNMKSIKMTDGGIKGVKKPSTDDSVLSEWVLIDDPVAAPFARIIQEYRSISKIYGTYIKGLLGWVDQDLRIHTTLKQHGTVTGRLASTDPNLMNIPRPKTDKYKIRDAFVATPGKVLVIFDYDQLEMKIMAHFSGDENMIKAILEGKDLHCFTVAMMFHEDYDEVYAAKKAKDTRQKLTDRQEYLVIKRDEGKATGFGLIYGIGEVKLGSQLNLKIVLVEGKRGTRKTCPDAAKLITSYLNQVYPGVGQFMAETHESCRKTEYVQTLLGRFRRLAGINISRGDKDNRGLAAEAERQSVNSIIQGTAADIAKAAMLRCEYDPVLQDLGAQMLLQIHDELIFEVDDVPEKIIATKKRVMELMADPFNGYQLHVPLTVGCNHGLTWSDAK